jgi:lipoprotein-anchoring transpeptidase ErfK/SrfK
MAFCAIVAIECGGAETAERSAIRPAFVGEPKAGQRDVILRVQIFLDGENFGPGIVDGQAGEFTRKAVAAWNVAHHRAPTDDWGAVLAESEKRVNSLHAAYRIREGDEKFLTSSLPSKPEQQEGFDYLGYRGLAEFVAERYHTSEKFLAALNPSRPLASLHTGDWLKVPNVEPFMIERLEPQRAWSRQSVLSTRAVLVDTGNKTAALYNENDALFAFFPITPGRKEFVPMGEWKIEVMLALPQFRWDKQMLEHGTRGPQAHLLAPGPNNPVGVLWAGLNKSGIGLHGTASPETIGRSRSAGCIRFANWDAVRLPELVRPGTRVLIK